MNLLIVDDSKAMRMLIRRALRQAGIAVDRCVEAASASEALKETESASFDFILCDWNMPGMLGIELLETLRDRGSRVRFGFITSERSPEVHQRARNAGASFIVTKPFTPEVLADAFAAVKVPVAV